jgi:hypothetical protein
MNTKNPYKIIGDCVEIYMVDKHGNPSGATLVDKVVFNDICKFRWHIDSVGYANANINKKSVRLHKFILSSKYFLVDHKNGNRLDNRSNNLRLVTKQENNFNRIIKNSGVRITAHGRWCARITWEGKTTKLGNYKIKEEAIRIHYNARNKYLDIIEERSKCRI